MKSFQNLEYIFLHLDGVLLENILGPILHSVIVNRLQGEYTSEIENHILAKPKESALEYLREKLRLNLTNEELFELYQKERSLFEKGNVISAHPGILPFLRLLKDSGLKIMAYGGAPETYFETNMGSYSEYFHDVRYIRTNEMRPGVLEIIRKYGLEHHKCLFMDEEAYVGQVAKENHVPFIGFVTNFSYSFQPEEMEKIGIKHKVKSLEEVDLNLLEKIDSECLEMKKEKAGKI
ncbi:HAD family hydrolase [Leptospira idonii]|uniref:HAD family hydrolase n=1 Tax=Leptospira idonii TaxID=1193500 RepID=A0A4V3JYF5_9LEPT|nr:HAD family hydrolase [Leptospira idonii]TGN21046.1 HAD family hydrolase [Leptospira idonii]